MIKVTYSSEGLLRKNGDQPGKQCERSFSSVDVARETSLPEHCVFAFVPVENGYHVHSARFGWEFFAKS